MEAAEEFRVVMIQLPTILRLAQRAAAPHGGHKRNQSCYDPTPNNSSARAASRFAAFSPAARAAQLSILYPLEETVAISVPSSSRISAA